MSEHLELDIKQKLVSTLILRDEDTLQISVSAGNKWDARDQLYIAILNKNYCDEPVPLCFDRVDIEALRDHFTDMLRIK